MAVVHDSVDPRWHDGLVRQDAARVDFVCVGDRHLHVGRDVPDGEGHLTVVGRKWAYCSAGLEEEPHAWSETGGLEFAEIRHADLEGFRRS